MKALSRSGDIHIKNRRVMSGLINKKLLEFLPPGSYGWPFGEIATLTAFGKTIANQICKEEKRKNGGR